MPTTAHEDQFTDAPVQPALQPYSTADILRRNVADLELALKQQAERAEAAESELLAVRDDNHSMMLEIDGLRKELARLREQKPALYMAFSDCGNFIRYWTRDTKNLEATMAVNDFEVLEFYTAPVPAPAPAVPKEWWEFAEKTASPGLHQTISGHACTCERCLAITSARALLKSAPQAPDAAADRLLEGGK